MGPLERASRERKNRRDIQGAVLAALAATGIIAIALIAPNALQALRYLPGRGNALRQRIKSATGRLVAKGHATWIKRGNGTYLRITKEGRRVLALAQAESALKDGGGRRAWDGRWRMVVFDVPERRCNVRYRLRWTMKRIGFARLQDSVWVYPYDCEEFIALLKAKLRIGRSVLYAIADTIEGDARLRREFNLPRS